MKINVVRDKSFYKRMFAIMIPVAAQQAINMGVNMMDTVMLGSFGEVQLSASSLANSFYSFFTVMCLGIIGGCSVLVAQFFGAGDLERARQTFSLAARMAVILGAVFAVLTFFFPAQIMRMFTSEEDVIAQGVRYLEITVWVFIIHGLSQVVSFLMRSVRVAQLGLYVSIISFFVNIFANWVFIFGKFGMPRMEIAGAALGTLIARIAEFIVTFWYVLRKDKVLGIKLSDFLHNPPGEIIRKYVGTGMPAMISDSLLGMGNTAVAMVLGRMGAAVVAANSICMVVDRLFTVIVQGVGNAASIITGNTIGEGNHEKALAEGNTFYIISIGIGLLNGLLMLAVAPLTMRFYNITPATLQVTKEMMLAYAFIIIFGSIQSVMTKGVLRGGGDTKFLMKADILFMWVVSIPLGLLVGPVLRLPGWLTIICLRIDYMIKSFWCISRLKSGKWIKNITR